MLHILALLTAKPGKRDDLLALFNANVPNVIAEEGCIEYAAAVDSDGFGSLATPLGADTFVVIEKWSSPDTLRAHGASPHMAQYARDAKALLERRVIHVLSPA